MNNPYSGGDFDDFLREEGILEEATASERLLALQLQDAITSSKLRRRQLAEARNTSRSQVDRLLDPDYTAVTLDSLERLALVLGKQLRVESAGASGSITWSNGSAKIGLLYTDGIFSIRTPTQARSTPAGNHLQQDHPP